MTKQILAYGDSLTWGANPGIGRHRFEDRWPSVIEAALSDARLVAEGLPGRTTCFDDPSAMEDRNGARTLPVLLGSHYPLDLAIIMLGTNDLKSQICGRAEGAAAGMERLIEIVAGYPYGHGHVPPKVMIVSPPHFRQPACGSLSGRDIQESKRLADIYRAVAERRECLFLDASTVAEASAADGVHLDAANTRAIGAAIADLLKKTGLL